MTHFTTRLPQQVELGAIRNLNYENEIVTTDGGYEVRNARWSSPLRTFEISFPTANRSDPVYQAVVALYAQTMGGLHSFEMIDWTDETGNTIVPVRFDTPLAIRGVDKYHDHIETLTLKEVRL